MSDVRDQRLVEECGLVAVEAFEDGAHECLADETAAIGHAVLVAETLQGLLLAFVKQDRDTMFAGLLFHAGDRLEHEYEF